MRISVLATILWTISIFSPIEETHAETLEVGALNQNPLIFDATGRLLGAYTAGGNIFNNKGYRLKLYTDTGYYVNWAMFFKTSDCSGQGFSITAEANGDVFLSYDQSGFIIAYTEIGVTPQSIDYHSVRRGSGCETRTGSGIYVPVFPNDPEITGAPNGIGTRDFPYPTPFYYDRESCPSVVPAEINPAYLNTIVKDASGRVLGSGPTKMIFSEKGYHFSITSPTGLLAEISGTYYQNSDCSGPGFVSVIGNGAGYVFSTTDMNGDFSIRYIKKREGPVYLSETFKIANPGPDSICINANTVGDFFPIFFNDPAITGVLNDLGSDENPYPVPLSYERFGSN